MRPSVRSAAAGFFLVYGLGTELLSQGAPRPDLRLAVRDPHEVADDLEKEGSLTALGQAAVLRAASSQRLGTAPAIDRFLTRLEATPSLSPSDQQAASDFLEEVLAPYEDTSADEPIGTPQNLLFRKAMSRINHEETTDPVWQPRMQRFIAAMTRTGALTAAPANYLHTSCK